MRQQTWSFECRSLCVHALLWLPPISWCAKYHHGHPRNRPSYGPFQSKLCTNFQVLIDESLHAEKPTSLSPWIVGLVVISGEDPETGCVVELAFQAGFAHIQNLRASAKVGAVPLARACLQNSNTFNWRWD